MADTNINISTVAGQVAQVDEIVIKYLPFIGSMVGLIPGAQPFVIAEPMILSLLTALDNAAKAVAAGNYTNAFDSVVKEIESHLTPGAPNSPHLAG